MRFIVDVVQFDRVKRPDSWEIFFEITHESGVVHHVPMIVYAQDLVQPTNEHAIKYAVVRALPAQFALDYKNEEPKLETDEEIINSIIETDDND